MDKKFISLLKHHAQECEMSSHRTRWMYVLAEILEKESNSMTFSVTKRIGKKLIGSIGK